MNEEEYKKFTLGLLDRTFDFIFNETKDISIGASIALKIFLESLAAMHIEWDDLMQTIIVHKDSYEIAVIKRKEEQKKE